MTAQTRINAGGDAFATPVSVPAWWRTLVDRHGQRELVRKDGRGFSFLDIDRRSAALARGLLAQGAGKGSRVGILLPNGPDWIVAWLATQRIGALAVNLSTFFAAREIAYAVRHADVSILLAAGTYLRHDYRARLEEAFPALAAHDGAHPLATPECPYLRSIWIADRSPPAWSRGSLADLEARGAADPAYTPALLAAAESEVAPADLGMLIYTSGSTSYPKGVVHTQGAAVGKVRFHAESAHLIPANTELGDRLLVTSPFFWVGGFLSLGGAMASGATVLCEDDHSPAALLAAVRREKATHLTAPEAVMRAIRTCDDYREGDLDGLKAVSSSQRAFSRALDGPRIWDSLGMTETIGPHSGTRFGGPPVPQALTSWGRPLDGVEYRIVDVETRQPVGPGVAGELCVRSPWLMDGFYKRLRADVFDADGFYPTGDECLLDEEGYLFFRGRLGGMIKTSGANVSPEEVEVAIRLQPEVLEAAVFPVPDPRIGQMVVAAVALRPGAVLDEDGLKARLRGEVSSFKIPKRIVFLDFDDIPRTASNKVRKPALVEMLRPRLTG